MILSQARVAAALPAYELGAELGTGSFGMVLAARHRRLGRQVAVKVLVAGGGADAGSAAEARLLAGFDHPHIVRIHDYLEHEGLHLIVMELLDGGTLAQHQAGLAPEGACAAGLVVAEALAYAHGQGVLHRDVKPSNTLFDTAGVLKVADFGLAKLVEGSATTASGVVGTVQYMAPEQIACGRLGPATDLYGLGVVIYQMLAGVAPFGPDLPVAALVHHHLHSPPVPLAGVPPAVAEVVLRALAKDPAERHPSAQAFALDLAEAAVRSYGAAWVARSGMRMWLSEEVRRVAERPPGWVSAPRRAGTELSWPPSGDGKIKKTRVGHRADAVPGVPVGHAHNPATDDDAGLPGRYARAPADPGPPGEHDSRLGASPPRRRRRVTHRRVTHRRWIVFPVAAAFALALAFPLLLIFLGLDQAPAPDRDAISRRLAGEALRVHAADHLDLAHRLAIAAFAIAPTREARRSLLVTADHSAQATLTGHDNEVSDVAFSPDGATLATAGADKSARLWKGDGGRNTDEALATLTGHDGWVYDVAFSPDGATLATVSVDGTARLWDAAGPGSARQPLATFTGHGDQVSEVVFSPDGATLATTGADGSARLWDTAWRGNVGEALATFTGHDGWIYDVAFSPDGATLATVGEDGTARLWDAAGRGSARQPLTTFTTGQKGLEGLLCGVVFSPDGTTLATSGIDGTARLWDAAARGTVGEALATFTGHRGRVFGVAFSPHGTTLATVGEDGTARLWDASWRGAVDEALATFTGHYGWVVGAVFSPDGATVATAGADGSARLWDADGRGYVGDALATLTGHAGRINEVAFSPDGATLATAGADSTGRVWDLDPDRLIEHACADPANHIIAADWSQYVPELPYDPPCD